MCTAAQRKGHGLHVHVRQMHAGLCPAHGGSALCIACVSVARQGAFGTASYELGVPMAPELRMPIASNTKLMTSVALHQLQEQVRLRAAGLCSSVRAHALPLPLQFFAFVAVTPPFRPQIQTVPPSHAPLRCSAALRRGCSTSRPLPPITLTQLILGWRGRGELFFACTKAGHSTPQPALVEALRRPQLQVHLTPSPAVCCAGAHGGTTPRRALPASSPRCTSC